MSDTLDLGAIRAKLREVAAEREWDRFHTPKNLAIALSVEAAELVERFTWLEDGDTAAIEARRESIEDEISDVLYYLVRLGDKLDVDIEAAFWRKLEKSLAKYPVDKSRGNMKKYTELGS